jgi:hypothetical protein
MANVAISAATTIPVIRPLPLFIAFIDRTFRSPVSSSGRSRAPLQDANSQQGVVKRF